MSVIIATLILALIAIWFLFKPHILPETIHSHNQHSQLEDQRTRLVQMLRDTELDFATNKLSESDYQRIKEELSLELAVVLERLA